MHATLTRIAAIVMVTSCGLTSSACDAQTEERKAIKDVIKRLETAYQEKRGHDAADWSRRPASRTTANC